MQMKNKFLCRVLCVALCITIFSACNDDSPGSVSQGNYVNRNANDNSLQPELSRLEMPHVKGGRSMVLIHTTGNDPFGINYAVEWDCDKRSQRWTAYQMGSGYIGSAGYYGKWSEDPELPAIARVNDSSAFYSGSGFTRGHILCSADRQYSKDANMQTFYYTNMQPQYYSHNAGDNYTSPWVRLEEKVRTWARAKETQVLYVVKGGTIDTEENILMGLRRGGTHYIGSDVLKKAENGDVLLVPKYFFVALLLELKQGYRAIGFCIVHDNADHGSNALVEYAMSIDNLENKTGIDFFCNLPDDIEDEVEAKIASNAWGL